MVFTLTFSYNVTNVTGRSRLLTIITLSQDCRCGALKRRTAAKLDFYFKDFAICYYYRFHTAVSHRLCYDITTPNKSFNNLDSVPCFCFTLECFYYKALVSTDTWMETSNKTHFYNFCYFTSLASLSKWRSMGQSDMDSQWIIHALKVFTGNEHW